VKRGAPPAKTFFFVERDRAFFLKGGGGGGGSVQSTTGSRGARISGCNGSNAGYTMFRGGLKSTGYPLHSPISPSLPFPCVTVCHYISAEVYTPSTAARK